MSQTRNCRERVHKHLVNQIDLHTRAFPLAKSLADNFDVGAERQAELSVLEGLMRQAATENQQMSTLVGSLAEEDKRDPVIQDATSQLASQVTRMIELFDQIEKRALDAKQRMLPELNQSLRAQRMHAAYSPESQ
jgi:hypothetical protein